MDDFFIGYVDGLGEGGVVVYFVYDGFLGEGVGDFVVGVVVYVVSY